MRDNPYREAVNRKPQEVLSINTGYLCNNNCVFCSDGLKLGKRSKQEIINEIKNNKNIKRAIFAYAEPTLNKDLVEFVKLCALLGYDRIALSTNGRMLSSGPFLMKLVESGMNEVIVSVHGYNRELQEAIVKAPGSFKQLKKGLNNIMNVRKKFKLNFLIATTVIKKNVNHLKEIHNFIMQFNPDSHIVNMVEPRGNAADQYKRLAPRYSKFVSALKDLWDNTSVADITVCDIPFCVSKKISNITGIREKQLFDSGKGTQIKIYDNQKRKRTLCRECCYTAVCPGVWIEYVRNYGWEEFQPIKDQV